MTRVPRAHQAPRDTGRAERAHTEHHGTIYEHTTQE